MDPMGVELTTLSRLEAARGEKGAGRPLAFVSGGAHGGKLVATTARADAPPAITFPDPAAWCVPWPNVAQRDCYHIAGASGLGKSTLARRILDVWRLANRRAFPKADLPVYICSQEGQSGEDPAFEGLDGPVTHVPLSEALGKVSITDLAGDGGPCAVVLDDIEGVHDRRVSEAVESFQRRLLETGRKPRVTVINIHHRGAGGRATRASLQEASYICVFPQALSGGNIGYMLKSYCAIPDEVRAQLKHASWGRYICISQNDFPPRIVGERRVTLFDADEASLAAKRAARHAAKAADAAEVGRGFDKLALRED